MMRYSLLGALLASFIASTLLAVEPDEVLNDPALEIRAREISKKLRCVVCLNQDIDNSNAGVARDLRLLVRERLTVGDTDKEVLGFVTARYGDYVLLKPPFKPATYALWFAPFVLLMVGGGIIATVLSQARRKTVTEGLSTSDERELSNFMASQREDQE